MCTHASHHDAAFKWLYWLQDLFLCLLELPMALFVAVDLLASAMSAPRKHAVVVEVVGLSAIATLAILLAHAWWLFSFPAWARAQRDTLWSLHLIVPHVLVRLSSLLLGNPPASSMLQELALLSLLWSVADLRPKRFIALFPHLAALCFIIHVASMWPNIDIVTLIHYAVCYSVRPILAYSASRFFCFALLWGVQRMLASHLSGNLKVLYPLAMVLASASVGRLLSAANLRLPDTFGPLMLMQQQGEATASAVIRLTLVDGSSALMSVLTAVVSSACLLALYFGVIALQALVGVMPEPAWRRCTCTAIFMLGGPNR